MIAWACRVMDRTGEAQGWRYGDRSKGPRGGVRPARYRRQVAEACMLVVHGAGDCRPGGGIQRARATRCARSAALTRAAATCRLRPSRADAAREAASVIRWRLASEARGLQTATIA